MSDRICTVEDCEGSVACRDLCMKHLTRLRRHGDVNALRPNARGRFIQSGPGYVRLTGSTHPLAKEGSVYEHRAALFDAIGDGEHPCNWCRRPLHWFPTEGQTQLHVDHLDGNNQNNDVANLVPTCAPCNTGRRTHYKLARTQCPNGHEYTPDNLVPNLSYRSCLICRRDRIRKQCDRAKERRRNRAT